MSITKVKFGECNGREVQLYTLDNGNGLVAEIMTYGGIIRKLIYKGVDVVLGRDTLEEYFDNDGYYGALIGRNSNRIENSEFDLNGKNYKLNANDGRNNLHGGISGFDKKVWDASEVDGEEPELVLSCVSPDGEEGFPGEVTVKVTYKLTKDNGISIHYEGKSDADTVLNMTNHSYFNLNGHNSGTIDGHKLSLFSSFYTPNTDECMPYGEVLSSKGTPFDFSSSLTFGERFASGFEQIEMFGGIDHNFVLDGYGFRCVGELSGDKSGITMKIYTDQSGVQIYTGNVIDDTRPCKDGCIYPKHGALCLETQTFPNSLKYTHFPNGFLKKGEKYDTVTVYKFV